MEMSLMGNEGGIALFMGGETTQSRAVVQSASVGYRLRAAMLKMEFDSGQIEVLERTRLECNVCKCYAVVKREYDRLLNEK